METSLMSIRQLSSFFQHFQGFSSFFKFRAVSLKAEILKMHHSGFLTELKSALAIRRCSDPDIPCFCRGGGEDLGCAEALSGIRMIESCRFANPQTILPEHLLLLSYMTKLCFTKARILEAFCRPFAGLL